MPLAVLYISLSTWLKEGAVPIEVLTTFAVAGMFYSLKFVWSPLVDHLKLPLLNKLGRRKSWMMFACLLLAIVFYNFSWLDPKEDVQSIFYLTVLMGFASATFDIAFDAFRIEKIDNESQGIAVANVTLGYRIGMMISGGWALIFADYYSFEKVFFNLAVLYILAIITLIFVKEPESAAERVNGLNLKSFKIAVIDPFVDFFSRQYSILFLLAIIFYKLGDVMLGIVANPFYIELGFSKTEIGLIVKNFGVAMTIFGTYLGGYIIVKYGNIKALMICGIAQSITNLSFVWLHHMGHDTSALAIAIAIENIASGMGSAALVGFVSNLCNRNYSATQYALLTSAAGLASHSVAAFGGSILKVIGWDLYFIMTIILAFPGLVLLFSLNKLLIKNQNK